MSIGTDALMLEIKHFIMERNTKTSKEELERNLTPDADFIGAGYVDSLIFVELIGFIDERFGISVDLGRIESRHMKSFAAFCTAVAAQG